LVDEVINGRDRVVEQLMGGKVVGEMDSREEYKGEERTQGEGYLVLGYFGLWEGKKICRGRRRRVGNNSFAAMVFLEDSHRGTSVAGSFRLRGQETLRIAGAREK
jgi:hypothetical protein